MADVGVWPLECLIKSGVAPAELALANAPGHPGWRRSFRAALPVSAGEIHRHIRTTLGTASLVARMAKNPPAMQETWVPPLGQEDPLEEGMATYSSILAWRIPWTEEPGRVRPWGCKETRLKRRSRQHSWCSSQDSLDEPPCVGAGTTSGSEWCQPWASLGPCGSAQPPPAGSSHPHLPRIPCPRFPHQTSPHPTENPLFPRAELMRRILVWAAHWINKSSLSPHKSLFQKHLSPCAGPLRGLHSEGRLPLVSHFSQGSFSNQTAHQAAGPSQEGKETQEHSVLCLLWGGVRVERLLLTCRASHSTTKHALYDACMQ